LHRAHSTPRGWPVGFPCRPAIAQVTGSSVKLRLPRIMARESLSISKVFDDFVLILFFYYWFLNVLGTKQQFHTDDGFRYSRLFYRSQLITNIETLLHTVSANVSIVRRTINTQTNKQTNKHSSFIIVFRLPVQPQTSTKHAKNFKRSRNNHFR
jgi:hypothetical protein